MESQPTKIECTAQRRLACALAQAISIGFLCAILGYWSPGADGGDRNGYLLEGKLFASGHAGISPANEFIFLGGHWVETSPGRFFLKYPPGLPAVYSVIYLALGAVRAPCWANLLSPVCATLALWGTFLILREIVSSFYALVGMIILAVSPVTVTFAMMPNSHAASLCAVVWGMFCVLKWRRNGNVSWGIAGGLILGFAATIRYTEATLLLPLVLVCLAPSPGTPGEGRGGGLRNLWTRCIPLIACTLPLLTVAIFNLTTLGHLNGYGLTNESTAFSLAYFLRNWPTMLLQLNMVALILIFPISVLGMIVMLKEQRDLGLIVLAWVLPTVMAYTAYYWAPQGYIVAYMRFILPAMPGMVLAAMWVLSRYFTGPRGAICAGILIALAALASMHAAAVMGEDLKRHNGACVIAGQHVSSHIPPHSMVLSEQRLLPHLETIGNYQTYLFCTLTRRYLTALGPEDTDQPQAMQPERIGEIADLARDHSDAELADIQRKLIDDAFDANQRVFLVLGESDIAYFRQQFLLGTPLKTKVIDLWVEPANLMTPIDTPAPASDAKPALASAQSYRTFEIVEILRD